MELFHYPIKTPRVFHVETTPRKNDSTILRKKFVELFAATILIDCTLLLTLPKLHLLC